MKLIPLLAIAAMTIPCLAQSKAPAEVFSGSDVAAKLASLVPAAKSSGSSGATLGDYQSHAIKLSVRTASGGAEVHAHYDDIFVVTGGKATLITGGTVVHAQTGGDGETKGSSIQDGKSQAIAKNDIVHIPAGTPHQLIIAPGEVFSTIVVKVKEE
jgi:mannose-6-phosphate isomerase-like protein (cupin superfamily)